ncbi:BTB/POZ domain-containing protein [Sesamum angolense]|uniref:BTB/POZ domain-containing protein n=1 Tax=Sesamum angolense TaxID=2727404 RepID=A0AAE1W749_9LAMI|nr:BTB/POZ domain-containing protein [Sesamum angolense]
MFSNLEVDINGQETFFVSMNLITSFSGKLWKLLSKSERGSVKLIFDEFPGGPEGFELILRFCYNGCRIDVSPCNVFLLHAAAEFLEIDEKHTMEYVESVHFWTWSELLDCLKQCQELLSFIKSSYMVQEILDAVVEKISMLNISSPFAFSCSDAQFSGDISTNCSRSSSFQTTNWLRDLEFLTVGLFEEVVRTMISRKLDHGMICSFLLHYQRVKFVGLLSGDLKCKIIKVMIDALCSINGCFMRFPFRHLCYMLQTCFTLEMEKQCARSLERMIGSRLDEATLDDLMFPSPSRKTCAYDVDLILRLLKIFIGESRKTPFVQRLKNVGCLIDSFLAEVAPDPHLKPSKFLALASGLPHTARESHDRICEVIDMYFEAHNNVSEEERIRVCSALDYEKLSSESLANSAKNARFPACASCAALLFLQVKLKTRSKDDNGPEFTCNSSLSSNVDDEQLLVHFSKGKVQKRSANVGRRSDHVTCPTNCKPLPRLCS